MRKILDYLRLILFTSGLLIGVQVPGFIDQYGKSLQAHLLESSLSLKAFQGDAERYFNGNLDQLIAHYQDNPDAVIRDGGASIAAISNRNLLLTQAWTRFTTSPYSAYRHVILQPITDIKDEVWRHYTYNIILNPSAIIVGLTCGMTLSLLAEFINALLVRLIRQLFRPLPVAPKH